MGQKISDSNVITKTIEHVKLLLKSSIGLNEIDELAIKQLCLQLFNERFNFAAKSVKNPIKLTFGEFKEWLYTLSPSNGDVVTYECEEDAGKVVVIVHCVGINEIRSGAALYSDGTLVTNYLSFPIDGYRKPTEEETRGIHKALSRSGLEWSYEYSKVVEKFMPLNGNYVCVTFPDGSEGVGVFSHIVDYNVIMYCFKKGDDPVQYSYEINIGLSDELQFRTLSAVEKKSILDELDSVGKSWNPYVKRIEDNNLRVPKGDPYYFINDRFYVIKVHETLSTLDNRRYANGNYFKTKEDGMEALSRAIHAIKTFHAEPNKGLLNISE